MKGHIRKNSVNSLLRCSSANSTLARTPTPLLQTNKLDFELMNFFSPSEPLYKKIDLNVRHKQFNEHRTGVEKPAVKTERMRPSSSTGCINSQRPHSSLAQRELNIKTEENELLNFCNNLGLNKNEEPFFTLSRKITLASSENRQNNTKRPLTARLNQGNSNHRANSINQILGCIVDEEILGTNFITHNIKRIPALTKNCFYLTGTQTESATKIANLHSNKKSEEKKEEIQPKEPQFIEQNEISADLKKLESYFDNRNTLVSIDLSNTKSLFEDTAQEAEQKTLNEALEFYTLYERQIGEMEREVHLMLGKKGVPAKELALSCVDCAELLAITQKEWFDCSEIIPYLMKLSYFQTKSLSTLKMMLKKEFHIRSYPEDRIIIAENSPVDEIHVILSGSVVKSDFIANDELLGLDREVQTTLFENSEFGCPNNTQDTTLPYRITTSEQSLIFSLPYIGYREIFNQTQNIADKIEVLKELLPRKFSNEDLELVAVGMESSKYSSSTIIARKNELLNGSIIVAEGIIGVISELVIERPKEHKIMFKKHKRKEFSETNIESELKSIEKITEESINSALTTERMSNFKNNSKNISMKLGTSKFPSEEKINITNESKIKREKSKFRKLTFDPSKLSVPSLSSVRRTNTAAHQMLSHSENTIFYYEQNEHEQCSRGNFIQHNGPLTFSLVSRSDNTRVYWLRNERVQQLPEALRNVIEMLKSDVQPLKCETVEEWSKYKEAVCYEALNKKLRV